MGIKTEGIDEDIQPLLIVKKLPFIDELPNVNHGDLKGGELDGHKGTNFLVISVEYSFYYGPDESQYSVRYHIDKA